MVFSYIGLNPYGILHMGIYPYGVLTIWVKTHMGDEMSTYFNEPIWEKPIWEKPIWEPIWLTIWVPKFTIWVHLDPSVLTMILFPSGKKVSVPWHVGLAKARHRQKTICSAQEE